MLLMNIESAQYMLDLNGDKKKIKVVIDGVTSFVPMQVGNRHYDEVLRQVEAGELTIQEAE